MELKIHEGSHLYDSEGENLGKVQQLVVDPSSGRLTHVLVEKGIFFPDGRVVPVGAIDRLDEDRLVLGDDVAFPDPASRETKQTRRRSQLPEGEMIDSNTAVITPGGEEIGRVSEMQVDEDGRLSHLVVHLGAFSGDRVLPAHWIESIASEGVRLAVGREALETLETLT